MLRLYKCIHRNANALMRVKNVRSHYLELKKKKKNAVE